MLTAFAAPGGVAAIVFSLWPNSGDLGGSAGTGVGVTVAGNWMANCRIIA